MTVPTDQRRNDQPTQRSLAPGDDWSRWVTICAWALVVLGAIWRILRFALGFPLWADEAFLALNFLDHDYLGLTGRLDHFQVAPVVFLWLQYTVYQLLGSSEYALRLLPLLAGLGALVLFTRLSRKLLDPLAAAVAAGLLAVSYFSTRYSCEAKPYAFDLLMAVLLMLSALCWLDPDRPVRRLILLIILTPVALAVSYPSIFTAAAIGLALLPTVWRQVGWPRRLYLCWSVVTVASFLGLYLLVGRAQLDPTAHSVDRFMQEAWAQAFPPLEPVQLLRWLAQAHTGVMLGYPVREAAPVIGLLCLLGAWEWLRARRWAVLALCGSPFAWTFLAALMRRYPYGDHPRLAQHLAPAIFLLAGTGASRLIMALAPSPTARRRWAIGVLGLLAAIGIACIGLDLRKPYKHEADLQARAMVRDLLARSEDTDGLVVCCAVQDLRPAVEWYLRRTGRIRCLGLHDEEAIQTSAQHLWYLALQSCTAAPAVQSAVLSRTGCAWVQCDRQSYLEMPDAGGAPDNRYEAFHWIALRPTASSSARCSPPE